MACPYFDPVMPQGRDTGPENARLPLGCVWEGICRAVPGEPWQPDRARLQPLCNLGYARESCTRFPIGDGPDAVRFAVARDDGSSVKLYYVLERDHHPFAHGQIDDSDGPAVHAAPLLARQATAYIQTYLRRKKEASRS